MLIIKFISDKLRYFLSFKPNPLPSTFYLLSQNIFALLGQTDAGVVPQGADSQHPHIILNGTELLFRNFIRIGKETYFFGADQVMEEMVLRRAIFEGGVDILEQFCQLLEDVCLSVEFRVGFGDDQTGRFTD